MSYTTVLEVRPGEGFSEIEELRNSWLSAPLVWDVIAKRYGTGGFFAEGDAFWNLWKDERLEPFERAVFLMTFDRAYVLKKDYAQAARDIGDFMAKRNVGGHWVRIRDLFASDPDMPAIGFHLTSVSDNPFGGDWNEEKEDHDSIDWDLAYSVYDEIAAIAIPSREGQDRETRLGAEQG
jgi:hypothetical protein